MKHHRKISVVFWILFLMFTVFLLLNVGENKQTNNQATSNEGGSSGTTNPIKVVPLTDEQRQKVIQTIKESDFFYDIPEKDPISIRFFYFEEGQRVWQDTFYMGHGELLDSAQAGIKLTLHSKYIDELENKDLCTVIQTANSNRDLGFDSPYSNSKLLWKYKSMLKHRDCFGF